MAVPAPPPDTSAAPPVEPDDELAFLGMRPAEAPGAWEVHLAERHMNPVGALYGGTGIAVATRAMAELTGRLPAWITTRFLASARAGEVVRVVATVDAAGRRSSQVSVQGTTDDRVVFDVLGACGAGADDATTGQWVEMPEVPTPDDCPPLSRLPGVPPSFLDTLERRRAFGSVPWEVDGPASSRLGLWTRVSGLPSTSPAMLAWLADCMPLGVGSALGRAPIGSSLDNTLRISGDQPGEWVLADIRPSASLRGYAHGDVLLWAEDGTLLATGSQTAVIRPQSVG